MALWRKEDVTGFKLSAEGSAGIYCAHAACVLLALCFAFFISFFGSCLSSRDDKYECDSCDDDEDDER